MTRRPTAMRPIRQYTIALPLLALFAACGGGGDVASLKDAGYAALDSGDAAAALPKFDKALGQLTAEDEDFIEVSVARCQALAYTDADKSRDDFLALATAHTDTVTDKDYKAVVSNLVDAGSLSVSVDVLDAGMKRFPEEPKMAQLLQTVKDKIEAKAKEDPEAAKAMEKMQGLGYMGD